VFRGRDPRQEARDNAEDEIRSQFERFR